MKTPAEPIEHVRAEETGAGRYQVMVHAADVQFFADQPRSVGGLGSGPTPHELISAALASCTLMTLRMYADRKGWSVDRIAVSVGHVQHSGNDRSMFDRVIRLPPGLDDMQTQRLLAIAERCPVHVLLERGAVVHTRAGPVSMHSVESNGLHERQMQDCVAATLRLHEGS